MTRLVYLGYSLLWHAPFPWSASCFDALRVRGFLGSPGTLICPGLLTCTARFNGLGFL
jgi:lysozyme family protein